MLRVWYCGGGDGLVARPRVSKAVVRSAMFAVVFSSLGTDGTTDEPFLSP